MTSPADFKSSGVVEVELPGGALPIFLNTQADRLRESGIVPRAWHWRELHNPWSRAAAIYDSWGFLDLCQCLASLDLVRSIIGNDIILFDSFWLPDPWEYSDRSWRTDHIMFPVEPRAGFTVLCGFARDAGHESAMTLQTGNRRIELVGGKMLAVDPACRYRIDGPEAGPPTVFGARYFPATSRYLRDAAHAARLALMERLPLFNFATMPLWQVAGEDRAGNDFVTGFKPRAPFWSAPPDALGYVPEFTSGRRKSSS